MSMIVELRPCKTYIKCIHGDTIFYEPVGKETKVRLKQYKYKFVSSCKFADSHSHIYAHRKEISASTDRFHETVGQRDRYKNVWCT